MLPSGPVFLTCTRLKAVSVRSQTLQTKSFRDVQNCPSCAKGFNSVVVGKVTIATSISKGGQYSKSEVSPKWVKNFYKTNFLVTEECGTDAQKSGAFCNGKGKVLRHTHREIWQSRS